MSTVYQYTDERGNLGAVAVSAKSEREARAKVREYQSVQMFGGNKGGPLRGYYFAPAASFPVHMRNRSTI